MHWLLVVVVLNTPIKTDLVYESLAACLKAEGEMRGQWIDLLNGVLKQNGPMPQWDDAKKKRFEFVSKQVPFGTCIPAK